MSRRDTRERLVDAARELFLEKGYHQSTTAEIVRRASANSGSLYYFFDSKQDLLVAVLEHYAQNIEPMLLQPAWADVGDPLERVFALLDRYRCLMAETDFLFGCPIGLLALELHDPDEKVRQRLGANFQAWSDAVRGCLEDLGHELSTSVDRAELAEFVLAVMEGAVMLARTSRSLDSFDAAVRHLRSYLEGLLGREAAGDPGLGP